MTFTSTSKNTKYKINIYWATPFAFQKMLQWIIIETIQVKGDDFCFQECFWSRFIFTTFYKVCINVSIVNVKILSTSITQTFIDSPIYINSMHGAYHTSVCYINYSSHWIFYSSMIRKMKIICIFIRKDMNFRDFIGNIENCISRKLWQTDQPAYWPANHQTRDRHKDINMEVTLPINIFFLFVQDGGPSWPEDVLLISNPFTSNLSWDFPLQPHTQDKPQNKYHLSQICWPLCGFCPHVF